MTEGDTVTDFQTFTSAYEAYKLKGMFFPLSVKTLHALKEKHIGGSIHHAGKTASTSGKAYYVKRLDKYMRTQKIKAVNTVKINKQLKKRWSKTRDGFRFVMAVAQNLNLWTKAFKTKTRADLDDKTATTPLSIFLQAIISLFNNTDWIPSALPEIEDSDDRDEVNMDVVNSMLKERENVEKRIEMTLKVAHQQVRKFEDRYIRSCMNMNKSGTHEHDMSNFVVDHVDLAYYYVKRAMPPHERDIGHGILSAGFDTSDPQKMKPKKVRGKKRSYDTANGSQMGDTIAKLLCFMERSHDPPRDVSSSVSTPTSKRKKLLKELLDLRKILQGMSEDDIDRQYFEDDAADVRKKLDALKRDSGSASTSPNEAVEGARSP